MEIVLAALVVLQDAESRTPDLRDVRLFVYDASQGLTVRVSKDGKVDVEIVQEGEGRKEVRRYSAASVEAFLDAHAEVVRRYGLDRYLSAPRAGPARPGRPRGPEFRGRPPSDGEEEWRRWFEEQEDLFREYRRFFRGPLAPPSLPPGPDRDPRETEVRGREFGVRIEGLDDRLWEQLGLGAGEGLRVIEVRPGTPAERAGLLKEDILLKVDGKPVTDIWQFRRDVRAALAKSEFEVEVLRAGERRTLRVKGGAGRADY